MVKYTETEILLAILEGDEEKANDLIGSMLKGELERFSNQVYHLQQLLDKWIREISDLPPRVQVLDDEYVK